MGQTYSFTCTKCGYDAGVSGGKDWGWYVVVRTSICKDCSNLVDVITGFRGNDGTYGTPEDKAEIGLCPDCRSKNVVPWGKGHPCPKKNQIPLGKGLLVLSQERFCIQEGTTAG